MVNDTDNSSSLFPECEELLPELHLKKLNGFMAQELFEEINKNRERLRWLPWIDSVNSVADELAYIERVNIKELAGQSFIRGLFFRDSIIGCCGIHRIDYPTSTFEIGYWIDKEFEGKGLISIVSSSFLQFGFTKLNLDIAEIRCAEENTKSQGVPKRHGFGGPVLRIPGGEVVMGIPTTQLIFRLSRDSFGVVKQ